MGRGRITVTPGFLFLMAWCNYADQQGLLLPAQVGDQGRNVLELCLRRDALLHIIEVAPLHPGLVGGGMEDGVFL